MPYLQSVERSLLRIPRELRATYHPAERQAALLASIAAERELKKGTA
jgi:hypothetical protein